MSFRDVGGMGEDELTKWLKSIGLIPNRAEYDKGSWDFFVQWPATHGNNEGITSLDRLSAPLSCWIQVKSSDAGRPPGLKLSNWRHLCLTGLPAFILLINFDGGITPKSACLIHVDKGWVSKTLERLRALPSEEGLSLHKHEMNVSWNTTDELKPPYPESLRERIETIVGTDPALYFERKQAWIREVGYETDGAGMHIKLSIHPDRERSAEDRLVDLALGLIDELPASSEDIEEVRFGISKPYGSGHPQEITVKLGAFVGERVVLSLREATGTRIAQLEGEFFNPLAAIPSLRKESLRFRFKTEYADFFLHGTSNRLQFRAREISLEDELAVGKIGNYADFVRALRDKEKDSLVLIIQFDGSPPISLSIGRPIFGETLPSDTVFEQASADAWFIARNFNLSPETKVTARELHSFSRHLEGCRMLLEATGASDIVTLQGDVNADAPPLEVQLGTSVVAPAFVGKILVVVGIAVYGRVSYGESLANNRKAFYVRDPSMKVVVKEVADDATGRTHSMRVYHERIRKWMKEHRIDVLPMEEFDPA